MVMPSEIISQIIYAAVFVAVLLLVEGIYLITRSSSRSHLATERRLRQEAPAQFRAPRVDLRRQQLTNYGPVSNLIVSLFPSIGPYLAQTRDGRISPAVAAFVALAGSVFVTLLLIFGFLIPITISMGAGVVVGFGFPMVVVGVIISGQKKKLVEQLPIAVDLVARGLEAGHPVSVALSLVGKEMDAPVGPAFRTALEEINFGLDRKVALNNMARKYPDPNLRFFVAAVEMQRETGGDLAAVLRNLSRVIRKRENIRKKALALSAEGRATAILVGALPFVLIGAISMMHPTYYTDTMDAPSFWPLMILAFVLWGLGMAWIWKMTDIKV